MAGLQTGRREKAVSKNKKQKNETIFKLSTCTATREEKDKREREGRENQLFATKNS